MPGNFRSSPYQLSLSNFLDYYQIICHQAVAPLDQLDGSLAFTNTALAGNKYSNPVNIDKDAMYGLTGSQALFQIIGQQTQKAGCGNICPQERDTIPVSLFYKYIRDFQSSGNYYTGQIISA